MCRLDLYEGPCLVAKEFEGRFELIKRAVGDTYNLCCAHTLMDVRKESTC